MATLIVLLFGMVSLFKLPVELYPNTSFGQISIIIQVRGGIPPTDVETLVTFPDDAHLFNLVDAIIARQRSQVYILAHGLVTDAPSQMKASVISVTSMLRSQFRSIMLVKSMKDDNLSENEMDDLAAFLESLTDDSLDPRLLRPLDPLTLKDGELSRRAGIEWRMKICGLSLRARNTH